jgi:hypothetical protein
MGSKPPELMLLDDLQEVLNDLRTIESSLKAAKESGIFLDNALAATSDSKKRVTSLMANFWLYLAHPRTQ